MNDAEDRLLPIPRVREMLEQTPHLPTMRSFDGRREFFPIDVMGRQYIQGDDDLQGFLLFFYRRRGGGSQLR